MPPTAALLTADGTHNGTGADYMYWTETHNTYLGLGDMVLCWLNSSGSGGQKPHACTNLTELTNHTHPTPNRVDATVQVNETDPSCPTVGSHLYVKMYLNGSVGVSYYCERGALEYADESSGSGDTDPLILGGSGDDGDDGGSGDDGNDGNPFCEHYYFNATLDAVLERNNNPLTSPFGGTHLTLDGQNVSITDIDSAFNHTFFRGMPQDPTLTSWVYSFFNMTEQIIRRALCE